MKRHTKFYALLIGTAMTASLLAGCTKKEPIPIAETLMEQAFDAEKMESGDVDLKILLSATMESQETEGISISGGSINIGMDMNVAFDEDTAKMSGTVDVSLLGMNVKTDMESYSQKFEEGTITYTKDVESGEWTKDITDMVDDEKSSLSIRDVMKDFDVSIFSDMKLQEVQDDDKEYVVTSVISKEKVEKMMENETYQEMMGEFGFDDDADASNVSFDVKATFDRETESLKSVEFNVNMDEISEEDVVIDDFKIKLSINKQGDTEVTVPEDIVKNAVEEDDEFLYDDDAVWEEDEFLHGGSLDDSDKSGYSEDISISYNESYSAWLATPFSFGDYKVTLGKTTLREFMENTGYGMTSYNDFDTENDYAINPKDSKEVSMSKGVRDNDIFMYVGVDNRTDELVDIKDCIITTFQYNTEYCMEEGTEYAPMSVCGINIGDKVDIPSILGEPESTYISKGVTTYTYCHDVDDISYNFDIEVSKEYGVYEIGFTTLYWD